MLPSEWREVLEQVGRHRAALPIEMAHGGFEVGGVPQHDRAGDQIERAGAVSLGLQAVVADAADAMEEDRALECVLRLALVQLARGLAALLGPFDPVEREQRALDPPYLTQRQRQAVRARVGAEPFQHHRCAGDAGADRGREPDRVHPVIGDQGLVDRLRR